MRFWHPILRSTIFCSFLLIPFLLLSQGFPLRGHVLDVVTGRPIVNANVFLVGTKFGTSSDSNGRFEIKAVPEGRFTLMITHIGYSDEQRVVFIPRNKELLVELQETFFQLGEIVVTGTRTENMHKNVPIVTEVISKKDILDSGARDVAQLLIERAGTFVNTSVAGGSTLNLLGIDSKYILVLVDGEPVTGKFNDRVSLDQFSTVIVDKIEIIKGPSSSLYGSEAMGGVVNIITRKEVTSTPFSISTRFTGSDKAHNILNQDDGKRDVRLNFSKRFNEVTGTFDLDITKGNIDQANQYINVDEFDKLWLRGNVRWTLVDIHIVEMRLSSFVNRENSHTNILDANTDIARNSLLLKHSWLRSPRWQFVTVLRGDTYRRQHIQERPWGELVDDNTSKETQFELGNNIIFESARNTLNFGIEINKTQFSSKRVEGKQQDLLMESFYFQIDKDITPEFTAVLGTRLDYNDDTKFVNSPRLALMYKIKERCKFRGVWGTGFRLPSFMDRYIDFNHTQFGYRVIGNPDLKPESSSGYLLGLEYYYSGEYLISFVFYQNRFNDMIADYAIEPGLFSYRNINQVRHTVFEIQTRWNISSSWLASLGYNYINNRNLTTGEMVPNTQPHSGNLRLSYKSINGKLSTSVKSKVVGNYYPEKYDPVLGEYIRSDRKRPAFIIIYFTGSMRLSSQFTLSLGVQNLGDYKDFQYGPFIGRIFYVELNAKLGRNLK